ncbi:MAG: glycoside hydrolase family 3 C-terminal domain-containing protein [Clostridia bacterium]|nr:glycoside hydrolase family 3 C-terminal domain-containing protein [Clostridia bacterium]
MKTSKKSSKKRTLKKVFLNIVAVLCVLMITANIIASANAVQIHSFLGTVPSKVVMKEGAENEGYVRYYESQYGSIKELKEAGNALVREAEQEGIVLLKNEGGLLPLAAGSEVSLVGLTAMDPVYGGTGSGAVDASDAPNYVDVVESAGYKLANKVLMNYYAEADKRTNTDMAEPKWSKVKRESKTEDDEMTLGNGEHVLFIVGRVGGEGDDMTREIEGSWEGDYLTLNENERDTLMGLAEMKADGDIASITVIINSANPVSVGFINDPEYGVDAALWVGSVGQTGLWAVGDVLSGAVTPSGSLPDTWWVDNQLNPVQNNFGSYTYEGAAGFNMGNRYDQYVVYQEGIYLGYRYTETRYEDVVLGTPNVGAYDYKSVVGYPFGYGLSYTTFEMSDLAVEKTGEGLETAYTATVKVTNTGDTAGKKTVQVYAQKPYTEYDRQNQIEKPAVELVGYAKTAVLEPGASETVTISVPEYYLTSYDALGTGVYILSEGTHYLTAADDSHAAINNILAVKGKTVADGMTDEGNPALVYSVDYAFDAETYSAAYGSGEKVTSLFDEADPNRYSGRGDNSVVYYSRSDWEGTVTPGYVKLTMTEQMASDALLDDSDLPAFTEEDEWPTMGKSQGIQLINMMEFAYDDPQWDVFLDQLTYEELAKICANGLRMTVGIESIGKPETLDHNGPSGVTQKYSLGPNGYATQTNDPDKELKGTCFPCNGIVAATFNDDLVYRVGQMIGEDAMWAGYAALYGSGLNIHRSPYSGRVFEYYSEDGMLTGMIDTAETRGIQEKGVYVYNKHFVLNDQEKNRAGIATWTNEQALREIYLRAFELPIVNADAKCVMTAYNRLGAVWAGSYRDLLTDWLRGEAGMKGFAVTDMYDGAYMVKVHEVMAGNDIPDDYVGDNLAEFSAYGPKGSKANPIVAQRMRESAKRVLYTVLHSRGMDGISNNSVVVPVTAWWQMILIVGQWTTVALTVLAAALLMVDIAKEKFPAKKAKK